MPPLLLRAAFWVGVVGFVASLAVHIATFTDAVLPGWTWALHVGLFVAFFPVIFGMGPWLEPEGLERFDLPRRLTLLRDFFGGLPRLHLAVLVLAGFYAAVNFGVGAATVFDDPSAGGPEARMFSGHWMFFYVSSAVLARHLLGLEPSPGEMAERRPEDAPDAPRGPA